jgi:hypothetical protein
MSDIAIFRQFALKSLDMKALLSLILVLTCGYVAWAQDSRVQAFAGCYELRPEGDRGNLPRRLQLTDHPARKGLAVRSLDPKVRWDLSNSFWQLKGEKAEVSWSTGYVGWDIQLSKDERGFQGKARFWTDTDSQFVSPRYSRVAVHAVDCGEFIEPKS